MIDEASQIMDEYKQGLQYHKQMGFIDEWVTYSNFKAGKQWPSATEKTKNMPRPVFNIIKFILNHKISNILNENVKMVFNPEEADDPNNPNPALQSAVDGADKFTKYSETVWENLDQDELNELALDDAATLGTCIWHYYWNNDIEGGITTQYKGDIEGEILDPVNVFFGNPQCRKVQKQPYILITSRELVNDIKELAKKNKIPVEKINLITADKNTNDEAYDNAKIELSGTEKATVITRYYKKNGRVYYKKVCSGVLIQDETDLGLGSQRGFKRYPLEVMSWELRKKSINGISEAEGLVPSQKAINFNIGMMMLAIQDTAWPKIYARLGALQQKITNIPGEVVTDHLMNGQKNIEYMVPGQLNQFAATLVDKIIDITRTVTGANEAATGDPFSKELNAAAIIAMQNAAKVPIDQIRRRYYRSIKNIGRIWEEFFKVKYNLDRNVVVKDENGKQVPMMFNGSNYADVPMKLKIDVGPGASYSESLMLTTLQSFLDKGYIDFLTFLEFAPNTAVPYKDRLKKLIEQQQSVVPGANGIDMNKVSSALSPEERAMLQKNPQLMQKVIKGGMANAKV